MMIGKIVKFVAVIACCSHVQAADVLWNTFSVDDFDVWKEGAWLLGSHLPYAPSVGFNADGTVWVDGCFNYDAGGAYWVHSYFGDELYSFDDYFKRTLLADVNYTGNAVIVGDGVSTHEYLAIIGITSNEYNPETKIETYYGWVELDGKTVVSSAITAAGPLRVGTGEVIPEPTAAMLLLLGLAGLALRRRLGRGDIRPRTGGNMIRI